MIEFWFGFTSHSTRARSFRGRFPKPVSRLGMGKKLNVTQQTHAFTNQKKCTTTRNKHEKTKVGLVAFYDIRSGNGAGLFSKEKIGKGGDKYGKSREKRKEKSKEKMMCLLVLSYASPLILFFFTLSLLPNTVK